MNGSDELIMTKLDVLDDFVEGRVLTGSGPDCRPLEGFPVAVGALEHCRPTWRSVPGGGASTAAARHWADPPQHAREYL